MLTSSVFYWAGVVAITIIGMLLFVGVYRVSSRERRRKMEIGLDIFGISFASLFAGLVIFAFGGALGVAGLNSLIGRPLIIQKEAIEWSVNIFVPAALIAGFISFKRAQSVPYDVPSFALGVTAAIGGFSGTMLKFYVENSLLDTSRALAFFFTYMICLLFFVLVTIVVALKLDSFKVLEIPSDAGREQSQQTSGTVENQDAVPVITPETVQHGNH